ncbi:glucan endo-1,3-beta-D-glucosidase [Exophiala viscosa]|uniref:Glucan endo-1,3-beta-D-glucosidase n=1 Tax=Exophiala viscosa TaxID=2486360 RepID=A0AAN6I9P7_9EURO|nr:glucan endo-1,3-beta-D-glucosidase [Exophiala viscosa]KAI1628463.1 glucan endo-1,3-beta-D-glucosidase [Exophiala viscosa]
MPFKNTFSQLKSQFKDLQQEGQKYLNEYQSNRQTNQQQQGQSQQDYPGAHQQYQGGPPPVPHRTHPGSNQPSTTYWQPLFDPSNPVSTDWEHKEGNNNGWGNNEIENYTSSPTNSFHASNKLILRAISLPNHPDPSQKYTSARLVSRQRLSRSRGSLVASLTLPCAAGIWPAFWLLPFEPFSWPTDGEVDIAETWNGDGINHSCLHWGFYTPQDTDKHRVVGTNVTGMQSGRPVMFEFAWWQDDNSNQGRLVWWIDGKAVMKAPMPAETRRMADFVVLLNIAMGGNVCQGQMPREGAYDFVVHEMKMLEEPENGGWPKFEKDWRKVREGDRI